MDLEESSSPQGRTAKSATEMTTRREETTKLLPGRAQSAVAPYNLASARCPIHISLIDK
jgi:hypothetical protein